MKHRIWVIAGLLLLIFHSQCKEPEPGMSPDWTYDPREYVVQRTAELITIDGRFEEDGWDNAKWTESFVDIRGKGFPLPEQATQVKMLWDDSTLYIAARLEETDLWATYTKRESIIFHENNFEFFIDPDGDTHNYVEYEINVLGTEWDLLMEKPYRDGGPSRSSWDFNELRNAVWVDGSINDPSDKDKAWQVEIAVPFDALPKSSAELGVFPAAGDIWRLNYSRVEWHIQPTDSGYVKIRGDRGKPLSEENWVWSPTGAVNMHMPECWGFIQFSDKLSGEADQFIPDGTDSIKWVLRQVYYAQRAYRSNTGEYAKDPVVLGLPKFPGEITVKNEGASYHASMLDSKGNKWYIENNSRIWAENITEK